jgi:hypothetical protein
MPKLPVYREKNSVKALKGGALSGPDNNVCYQNQRALRLLRVRAERRNSLSDNRLGSDRAPPRTRHTC